MSHAHNLKRKADWLKLNLIEDSIDRQKLRLRQGIGEREREGGGGGGGGGALSCCPHVVLFCLMWLVTSKLLMQFSVS